MMPTIEGILSEENREFVSSLGDWTGDATWDPGPIGGLEGVAKFVIGVYPNIKTIQLSYPSVKSPKDFLVGFVFYTYFPSSENSINRRLRITDGVYSFERDWSNQEFPDEWLSLGFSVDLPADWNKENITIFLDVQMGVSGFPGVAYADRASLTWLTITQHLPVMGIG